MHLPDWMKRTRNILLIFLGIFLAAAAVVGITLLRNGRRSPLISTPAATREADVTYASIHVQDPIMTPNPDIIRNLSHSAKDISFDKEGQINQPGIWNSELFFSAGSGSLDDPVLTRLYLYSFTTHKSQKIKETQIYKGEYYETLINDKWLVYLETDHGTNNYIYVMNRSDSKVSLIKNCNNGKPKLRLYDDTLIWMEQDENEDRLYMVDLLSQENVSLFSFSDVATYGTSAPSIYGAWIAWAGPDPEPVEDSTVTSAIYYVNLDEDIHDDGLQMRTYRPDTYVHEPLFNGRYFCWIDTNKSFNARLYVAQPNATPVVIDGGVSAYGLGDGIVVYGKNNAIYVYVIATGEICMLTGAGEKGILPQVSGRTVLWQNKTETGRDTYRYKILTDEELYPNGLPEGVEPYTSPEPVLPTQTLPVEETTAQTATAAVPTTAETTAAEEPTEG